VYAEAKTTVADYAKPLRAATNINVAPRKALTVVGNATSLPATKECSQKAMMSDFGRLSNI